MHRVLSARVIGYLILLTVIDFTILPLFRIGSVQPILAYLLVLYVTFQWGWQKTVPIALAVGLVRDLTGGQYFGFETVALLYNSILLDLVARHIGRDSWLLKISAAFFFIFCVQMLHIILLSIFTQLTYVSWYWCGQTLASAMYTALTVPIFFYFTARWFGDRMIMKQYELFQ